MLHTCVFVAGNSRTVASVERASSQSSPYRVFQLQHMYTLSLVGRFFRFFLLPFPSPAPSPPPPPLFSSTPLHFYTHTRATGVTRHRLRTHARFSVAPSFLVLIASVIIVIGADRCGGDGGLLFLSARSPSPLPSRTCANVLFYPATMHQVTKLVSGRSRIKRDRTKELVSHEHLEWESWKGRVVVDCHVGYAEERPRGTEPVEPVLALAIRVRKPDSGHRRDDGASEATVSSPSCRLRPEHRHRGRRCAAPRDAARPRRHVPRLRHC